MAPYVGNLESNTLFCYFPTPAEVVNMLKDVCVDGFYFVGMVLDASSIFLGWGQAALFICSFSSANKSVVV